MALTVTHVKVSAIADDVTRPDEIQPSEWGSTATVGPTHVVTGSVDLAAAATVLATPRTINGVAFDGSGNIVLPAPTKADVGLALVENTALSTWGGSANLTTLGGSVTTAASALTLNKNSVKIGDGRPLGPPVGTIVATDTGVAGNVTGTVKYAYTETCYGETTIGPITTITVTNKQVSLLIPAIRRGVVTRRIYRTVAGGSVFKFLFEHDGGFGLQQNVYVDTMLDSGLGATAPAVDASAFVSAWINNNVKFLHTHPDQGAAASDFTVLTTQNDGATGYAIDAYGPILARTAGPIAQSFLSIGQACLSHFVAYTINPTMGDNSSTLVFKVGGLGHVSLAPATLHDPAVADGASVALSSVSTFGTGFTANAIAHSLTVTGGGSAAFEQTALLAALLVGYTGTAKTYAARLTNNTVAGSAIALYATASGAAPVNSIGVWGAGNTSATNRYFGGFFSDGTDPITMAAPGGGTVGAALACSNGSGVNDIFVAYDNLTPVLRVKNDGDVDHVNVGATATITLKTTTGGGAIALRVNGGSTSDIGSTNNIPVRIITNNVVAATFSTAGALTVVGAFGCNTKAAQGSVASGGALATYGAGANGFDSGANASAVHALVVTMRAALVANGILS